MRACVRCSRRNGWPGRLACFLMGCWGRSGARRGGCGRKRWVTPVPGGSKRSWGVGRQYTGSAGKITNCQIGVFAAYVSRHGHGFIDRALYLPKAWTSDPARMAAAQVPPDTGFATKPALALAIIARAIAAGVPFAWVAAEIADKLDPSAWHRLSAGTGAKDERLFDCADLELADLELTEYNE